MRCSQTKVNQTSHSLIHFNNLDPFFHPTFLLTISKVWMDRNPESYSCGVIWSDVIIIELSFIIKVLMKPQNCGKIVVYLMPSLEMT